MKNSRTIQTNHKKSIYRVIFLENETKFATASDDSSIKIYDTESGNMIRELNGKINIKFKLNIKFSLNQELELKNIKPSILTKNF